MPGEFASGLTAEGSGGAAGRRFCLLFSLQKKVGRRAGAQPRKNIAHQPIGQNLSLGKKWKNIASPSKEPSRASGSGRLFIGWHNNTVFAEKLKMIPRV
jgi:hypothetical protein